MDKEVQLHIAGNDLLISFEYDQVLYAKAKQLHGTRWSKELQRWVAPLASYDQVVAMFDNLKISKGVIQRLQEDAERKRKVQQIKDAEYIELNDYASKLPLMSHQKKAFELHRLLDGSGNFSEMGAGKTASTICAIHWQLLMKNITRCLVVCPKAAVKSGWEEQIDKFSNLSYIALVGTRDQRLKKLTQDRDIYIINYEGLRLLENDLLNRGFQMVVLDEIHKIKSPTTKQAQAAYRLGDKARYRIGLTGSPVANSGIDAFGIMRFIDPTIFGPSFYAFRNRYFKNVAPAKSIIPMYVAKAGSEEEISDKIYSVGIRFLKEECLELPEAVTLPDRIVTLTPEQDAAYDKMQKELLIELGKEKKVKVSHILTSLMKLSQIASGHLRVPQTGEVIQFEPNPKLEELKDVVEEIKAPMIIWAYYKIDMKMIYDAFARCTNEKCRILINDVPEDACPECGTPILHRASIVDGSTKDRDFQIARFRFTPEERAQTRAKREANGDHPKEIKLELGDLLPNGKEKPQTDIIVCQLQAASESLNLQRATYSIYYSRTYSILQYSQSLARNHRAGQKNTVSYINLVASREDGSDTVEQKVLAALKRKENLARKINKDDIKMMLGNFKKKDREALKTVDELMEDIDIDFDITEENEKTFDPEAQVEVPPPSEASEDPVDTPEFKAATQKSLFQD